MGPELDLGSYFSRIGYQGTPRADLATLQALHRAHAYSIPFENLAIQLGELPLRLDLASLQDKLVRRRRGGYCFEQNSLFLAALRRIGFEVEPHEARVRPPGLADPLPRTHMNLQVRLPEGRFLADVGFGGQGLREPLPMDGGAHRQGPDEFRVVPEGPLQVLQTRQSLQWQDLYAIEPGLKHPVDFELGNWYTSTHPESRFVLTLTAQKPTPEGRHILRGLSYTVVEGGRAEERLLQRHEVAPLLRDVFGLDIPDDARFRSLDG
ncbi:MAG TPA: arylamine N-acetyltransferase [Holophagaceae bacterium]|nr:arylamine N-acetyltransferase [Holophagaceae bacterium]